MKTPPNAHLRWDTISTEDSADYRVFRTQRVQRRHPQSQEIRNFSVIQAPDWVNVIAITEDQEVIFVKQYRHGVADLTLEIPGGMIDESVARRDRVHR